MQSKEHTVKTVTCLVPVTLAFALAACGQQPQPAAEAVAPPPSASPAAPPVAAALKGGEQVYQEVCLACHASGVAGAPRAGEPGGWAALASEGQAAVTAHGWVGIRGMPPKGGRADLSLEEFARATAWMARSTGVDWAEPDAAMLEAIRKEEALRREALAAKG
jgi:cytochrome c5